MPTSFHPAAPAGASFQLADIPPRQAQGLDGGMHDVAIYLAGATHLRDHLKPLGITAFKIGATGCRDAGQRVEDLRRKSYASILKRPHDNSDPGVILTSGHEWFMVPLQHGWLDGGSLPDRIKLADGIIRLEVPQAVTVEMVDRRLHDLLRPRTLNTYLTSADGQARLVEAGYDPLARLHTRYTLMTRSPRLSLADELYLIRPRRELAAFVAMLGDMVSTLSAETDTATQPSPAACDT